LAAGPAGRQGSQSPIAGTVIAKIRTSLARLWRSGPAGASAGASATNHVAAGTPSNGFGVDTDGTDANGVPDELAAISEQLEGLTAGYALALRRLERALAEFEIEPIEALGQAVDPEKMEVVQSICDADQPPGAVVAEVRRGYRRRGRIMRFAQVVVNRTSA
jgi:hypothetical protein